MQQNKEDGVFPSHWVKEGYFFREPSDKSKYPVEMYTVDPKEFCPVPKAGEEGVSNWGLAEPKLGAPAQVDGVSDDIMSYMQSVMFKGNLPFLYEGYQTPYEQYIDVLAKRKTQELKSQKIQEALKTTLRVKISLKDCEEDCWRVFTVPASTSLSVVSDQIIGPIMGWCRGYHGHMFLDPRDGAVLGPKKYSGYLDLMHVKTHFHDYMDDRKMPLAGLLSAVGDKCQYLYDLGDGWFHYLEVLEVLHEGDPGYGEVTLLDGRGACPPEDSNGLEGMGIQGYPQLLEKYKNTPELCKKALRAASASVNYSSRGLTFSPLRFNLAYHQHELAVILHGPKVAKPFDFTMNSLRESSSACWHCGDRLKPLKKCSRCNTAMYCCRGCQSSDWAEHKTFCRDHAAKTRTRRSRLKFDELSFVTFLLKGRVGTEHRNPIISGFWPLLVDLVVRFLCLPCPNCLHLSVMLTKKGQFPSHWKKKGYVFVDPSDKNVYPIEFSTVDPATFTPPSYLAVGPHRNWALEDPEVDANGKPIDMMKMFMAKAAVFNMYQKYPSPFEQYVGVIVKRKLETIATPVVQDALKATFIIRMELTGSGGDCWRMFTIPAATPLCTLHDQILGPIMGWSRKRHGYVFQDPRDGAVLGPKKNSSEFADMKHANLKFNTYMDDHDIPLALLLHSVGDYCWYVYDVGDHWEHGMKVVQVLHEGDAGYGQIALLGGRGACPGEDSVGLEGKGCEAYKSFLQMYKSQPQLCKRTLKAAAGAANYQDKPFEYDPLVFHLSHHQRELAARLAGNTTALLAIEDAPVVDHTQVSYLHCWHCEDKTSVLMKCGKCNTATYCCRGCQVTDWKSHKDNCKVLCDAAAASAVSVAEVDVSVDEVAKSLGEVAVADT